MNQTTKVTNALDELRQTERELEEAEKRLAELKARRGQNRAAAARVIKATFNKPVLYRGVIYWHDEDEGLLEQEFEGAILPVPVEGQR